MQLSINQDTLCGYDGAVTISVPMSVLKRMYAKVRKHVGLSGEEEDLAGFFDFVKKAVHGLKKVVDNPLVKAVVGVIPYGGTAMVALEAGDKALQATNKAIRKNKVIHKAVLAAAKGNPRAKAAIARLSPTMKKRVNQAALLQKNAIMLAREMKVFRGALEAEGYTPAMRKVLSTPHAPWNLRRT